MPKRAKQGIRLGRMVWPIKSFNNLKNPLTTTIPYVLHDLICGSTAHCCGYVVVSDCESGFGHLGKRRFELMFQIGGEAPDELR